jgi:FkbM family methyltransferase
MASAYASFDQGAAALERGDLPSACVAFEAAVAADAAHHEAWHQLGLVHHRCHRFEEAIEAINRAITEGAEHPRVFSNLGTAYHHGGRADEALESYAEAIDRDPDLVSARTNSAVLLTARFDYARAEAHLRRVLEIDPSHGSAWNNLGVLCRDTLRLDAAIAAFREALSVDPDDTLAHSNLLLTLNYLEGLSAEEIFEAHAAYGARVGSGNRMPTPGWRDGEPLRVGYVSGDLRRHSVAFFIEPVLAAHDRSRFHVTCYSNNSSSDAITARLQALSDRWRDITHADDTQVREMIVEDGIDILVDLSGHSSRNRLPLFAGRAAPVQATWLGYPNTTGLAAMDHRITDAIADPDGAEDHHTEALVRLDGGFHCYQPVDGGPDVAALPSLGGAPFTFGSFNNLLKVTDEVLRAWATILRATPGSRLLLKAYQLQGEGAREHVRAVLGSAGISEDRLLLEGWAQGFGDHLRHYHRVDLALDPFPYNGTTTTLEALWMGVPTVTLAGDRHAGRVGASLMTHVGLSAFVAESLERYVALAGFLASDTTRLASLRSGLRGALRGSGLCDGPRFTAELERAYDTMVGRPGAAPRTTHTLVDGAKVVTPSGHHLLTPYVLAEQGDWFEDEIRFLRRWAQPGATVLDIGANYGTFALSLAKAVGEGGRVVAVEPTPDTADCLRASIAENGFSHLELVEAALSDTAGTLHLRLEADSELNALADGPSDDGRSVEVQSLTLDGMMEARGWPDLDFVKLDAEGAEILILQGGEQTLRRSSPLVLFEIKHAETLNLKLADAFTSRGFELYILVPGLQVLAPFDPDLPLDAFQLNLFACRPDRAEKLVSRGLLVRAAEEVTDPGPAGALACALGTLPYALAFASHWQAAGRRPGAVDYLEGLEHYAVAREESAATAPQRLARLDAAITSCTRALGLSATAARRHTLSRLLRERGSRLASVELLASLISDVTAGTIELDEPFFVAEPEFETMAPGDDLGGWCLAAAVTARIRGAAFSGYFARESAKPALETLARLGFLSPSMARRLKLLSGSPEAAS